jgi:hypothetical protein
MTSCVHKMCERTYGQTKPISRMVDFCESYSPFYVCLTIRPFAHIVYSTSHLSFVAFYSYLGSIKECKECWNQDMCILPGQLASKRLE